MHRRSCGATFQVDEVVTRMQALVLQLPSTHEHVDAARYFDSLLWHCLNESHKIWRALILTCTTECSRVFFTAASKVPIGVMTCFRGASIYINGAFRILLLSCCNAKSS